MRDHFLFPQLTDVGFVHEPPVVKLCNGLLGDALNRGVERLELSTPAPGAPISGIRAYRGGKASSYFDIPASMFPVVLRRFKVMAKMRRVRPMDEQGVIRVERAGSPPIEIRVSTHLRSDGTEDVVLSLPAIHS